MNGRDLPFRPSNGAQPQQPPAWDEHAATAEGGLLAIERGAVQFVGKHPILLEETRITVPLSVLLNTVAVMLAQQQGLMQFVGQPTPEGAMLRAFFAQQSGTPPG